MVIYLNENIDSNEVYLGILRQFLTLYLKGAFATCCDVIKMKNIIFVI